MKVRKLAGPAFFFLNTQITLVLQYGHDDENVVHLGRFCACIRAGQVFLIFVNLISQPVHKSWASGQYLVNIKQANLIT